MLTWVRIAGRRTVFWVLVARDTLLPRPLPPVHRCLYYLIRTCVFVLNLSFLCMFFCLLLRRYRFPIIAFKCVRNFFFSDIVQKFHFLSGIISEMDMCCFFYVFFVNCSSFFLLKFLRSYFLVSVFGCHLSLS